MSSMMKHSVVSILGIVTGVILHRGWNWLVNLETQAFNEVEAVICIQRMWRAYSTSTKQKCINSSKDHRKEEPIEEKNGKEIEHEVGKEVEKENVSITFLKEYIECNPNKKPCESMNATEINDNTTSNPWDIMDNVQNDEKEMQSNSNDLVTHLQLANRSNNKNHIHQQAIILQRSEDLTNDKDDDPWKKDIQLTNPFSPPFSSFYHTQSWEIPVEPKERRNGILLQSRTKSLPLYTNDRKSLQRISSSNQLSSLNYPLKIQVRIISAQGLTVESAYVRIQCGEIVSPPTKISRGKYSLHWNEFVQFDLQHENEELEILVYKKNMIVKDQIIGRTTIPHCFIDGRIRGGLKLKSDDTDNSSITLSIGEIKERQDHSSPSVSPTSFANTA